MTGFVRFAAGSFVLAHGLVFLLYLVKNPDDQNFPFTFERSWIVPEAARRPVGLALMVATTVLFVLLALAIWGVPGLSAVWPALAVAAAVVSLALLVAYWQTQLVLGVMIAVGLIAIAVSKPGWTDSIS